MFPTEEAATEWFESVRWPTERCCGHCGSVATRQVPRKRPMPYWCTDCRSYFSVRTGTSIARSNVPLRKWAIAIYLCLTSLKSVSSMKMHRDLGVTQKTPWFMLHRIREAWADVAMLDGFDGPVEADETYMGGRESNKHEFDKLHAGRGAVGKTAVAGVRDRATKEVGAAVIPDTKGDTLCDFVAERTSPDALVYSDEAAVYRQLPNHEAVAHSVGEYVLGDGPHQWDGKLLEHVETRPHGNLPQAQPEAPEPLRSGVRLQAQHAGFRHARADA